MKKFLVSIISNFWIALFECSNNYTNITQNEPDAMLNDGVERQYLDVISKEEYQDCHIYGFMLNIDYYDLSSNYMLLDNLAYVII